jgi:hypothetical protein
MTLYMTLTQNHFGHKRIQKGKQHLNQSPALLMNEDHGENENPRTATAYIS